MAVESPRVVSTAEARANLSEIVSEAGYAGRETIIQRNNKPLAVVIGYADYQALTALREEAREREARFAVYDAVRERNPGAAPEEVERDVTAAVRAIRERKA